MKDENKKAAHKWIGRIAPVYAGLGAAKTECKWAEDALYDEWSKTRGTLKMGIYDENNKNFIWWAK